MLTLFSIPKPFCKNIEIIQRNAIKSWFKLRPKCEIILFGEDEGTAEVAAEFGVRHIPEVAHNEYGTPLLNSLFEKAQRIAKYQLMAYVNADIILMGDFMEVVQQVKRKRKFLLIGQRWDFELRNELKFDDPEWELYLKEALKEKGVLHAPTGIDYFIFPRGLYNDHIPPFAIGRTVWDNWLVYRARSLGAAVIDATQVITAVHQNHSYDHIPDGIEGAWKGPEAKRNLELAGGDECIFTIEDATHILTPAGLRQAPLFKLRDRNKERKCKVLLWHAQDYLQQNRYREAEDELKKALSLELPDKNTKTNILITLGDIYLQQRRYKEAEKEYKKALALEPLDKNVKCNILIQLGNLYSQQQKFNEAEEKLKKALAVKSVDKNVIISIHYAMGSNYEKEGLIEKAIEKFEKVIKFAEENPSFANKDKFLGGVHFHLGRIYQDMEEKSRAAREFKRCLELIPDHREAKRNLKKLGGIK